MVPTALLPVSLAISVLALAACGGASEGYHIPADHPIKPFEEPEREELIEQEEEDAWDIDFDEAEEGEGAQEDVDPEPEGDEEAGAGKTPSVKIGAVEAGGGLDKAVIQRYIRRKLSRIRYCYEKRLIKDPFLEGTVRAEFVIGADGKVQKASASGMGNQKVEQCVASAIRAIAFPKPKGGGKVRVVYPFNFQSGS